MFKYTLKESILLPSLLAIFIAMGVLFKIFLKTERSRKIVFIVIGVLIFTLEIVKQIYCAFATDYDYWKLPLHFCSLYVFLYPLAHWFGKKCSKIFKPLAFVYSMIGAVLLYVFPSVLLGNTAENVLGSFVNFHGFVFHNLISLYLVMSICLADYEAKLTDCVNCSIGIIVYASYAIPSAYHFNMNYVNILYSPISIVEKIRLKVGQPVYILFLIFIGVLVSCLIVLLTWFIQNKICKRQRKS